MLDFIVKVNFQMNKNWLSSKFFRNILDSLLMSMDIYLDKLAEKIEGLRQRNDKSMLKQKSVFFTDFHH